MAEFREPTRGELPRDSAIILIPDAPTGIDFGIDCMQYETGPHFKGISMCPPGLHFIYHSIGVGTRQGYFFIANKGDVLVNPWNTAADEISPVNSLSAQSMETLQMQLARGDLNANLGPYPIDQHSVWKNLISLVNRQTLKRARCEIGTIVTSFDDDLHSVDAPTPGSQTVSLAVTPEFVDIFGAENELNIVFSSDSSSERSHMITAVNLDKSKVLEKLLASDYNNDWSNVLGELQLSFLLFMLLYSYKALNHWKTLIYLICRSESYLQANHNFSCAFLRVLYEQLHFTPADFFTVELSKENFLCPAISALFSSLEGLGEIGTATFLPDTEAAAAELDVAAAAVSSSSQGLSQSDSRSLSLLFEHRKRFFLFVQKRFGLFEGGSNLDAINFTSDKFNLSPEDGPVIVSREDLPRDFFEDEESSGVFSSEGRSTVASVSEDATEVQRRWQAIDTAMGVGVPQSRSAPSSAASTAAAQAVSFDMEVVSEEQEERAASPVAPMDAATVAASVFGWRYPLLFAEMETSGGKEDLIMTAMRVLDSVDESTAAVMLKREALLYVECEGGR